MRELRRIIENVLHLAGASSLLSYAEAARDADRLRELRAGLQAARRLASSVPATTGGAGSDGVGSAMQGQLGATGVNWMQLCGLRGLHATPSGSNVRADSHHQAEVAAVEFVLAGLRRGLSWTTPTTAAAATTAVVAMPPPLWRFRLLALRQHVVMTLVRNVNDSRSSSADRVGLLRCLRSIAAAALLPAPGQGTEDQRVSPLLGALVAAVMRILHSEAPAAAMFSCAIARYMRGGFVGGAWDGTYSLSVVCTSVVPHAWKPGRWCCS